MVRGIDPRKPDSDRPVFWIALHATLRRAPLWLLAFCVTAGLALIATWPWYGWFKDTLEASYEPGSQLFALGSTFRHDQAAGLSALQSSTTRVGAAMVLLIVLIHVFMAGGWLQIFLQRIDGHAVRRFFFGGSRFFMRFLRVLLMTLVLLALADWLIFGPAWDDLVVERFWGVTGGDLEALRSERQAVEVLWWQSGMQVVCYALILTWATYTRTRLAMHEGRSVLAAGAGSFASMFLHPIKTLRPMLALTLCEAAALVLAGLLAGWLQGSFDGGTGIWSVLLLFLLGLLPLVWGQIIRGARYHAALQVSHDVVAPLSRPDPWGRRVGGPGGPQYPIDDSDEYGISI